MKKKSYSKKEKSKNLQFSANTTMQSLPPAEVAAVAQHLSRIHNEFSVKLRTLQQTVEKNQRTTILFSKALYQFVRPLRFVSFCLRTLRHPADNIRIIRDYLYIKRSGMFDKNFYLQVYPDVNACAYNPVLHYCRFGWREQKNPSAQFVTAEYLKRNPDVNALGMNPFYHYLRYGRKESWRDLRVSAQTNSLSGELTRIAFSVNQASLDNETIKDISKNIRKGLYAQ